MYLIHRGTIKNTDGVIDVEVSIVKDKKVNTYNYHLSSDHAAEKFHAFYRKGRDFHGKALAILNKFKIKEEK